MCRCFVRVRLRPDLPLQGLVNGLMQGIFSARAQRLFGYVVYCTEFRYDTYSVLEE